ncbi:MAG: PHP domain-containing protein, partial [Phycisphaerae bacterium]
MTRTPKDQPAGDLDTYRAREAVLYNLADALAKADKWDAFASDLEQRGLPEARIRQIVAVPVPMDLHLHSTASDGQVPPAKLAWLARVIGLKTIALADHDSVSGVRTFYSEATLLGLTAVPAVELSTE